MIYTFIARACHDLPVSSCCRVMRVSRSGFYAWQAKPDTATRISMTRTCPTRSSTSERMSRRSYGSPRVHAKLRLGEDMLFRANASSA